jgi:Mrp family chromosome partitioning ATPase
MALLFDRFYGGIIDPRDLQNVIGETSVCVLPKVNLNTGRASVFKHPFGYFAESLRMILAQVDGVIFSGDLAEVSRGAPRDSRAELGHQTCDQNANVIGITSSSINEGKTTTAIGLASVAALNGLETCLIDFDFRRPSVSKYMGLSEESGLMAYLADEQENLILQRMEIEDDNTICFDVISDGWRDNSFSFAAIHPARLGALLEKLKRKYDYVVVDMPPILSASETKSISKQCDAVVFCARKSFCSRRTIVEGYNALNSVQPNLKKSVVALTCSPSKLNNQNYYYKNYAAK